MQAHRSVFLYRELIIVAALAGVVVKLIAVFSFLILLLLALLKKIVQMLYCCLGLRIRTWLAAAAL